MRPPLQRLLAGAAVVLAVATAGAACADGDEPGPRRADWPGELTAYVDQGRIQRATREVFVRLVNDGGSSYTVTRAEISSDAFGEVTWTGEETFRNETDLEFQVPRGGCAGSGDAEVRLTYRVDGAEARVSTGTATDRYGAIAFLLERDCARAALEEAADVRIGEPRTSGAGRGATFTLPVTLVPTGDRDDVALLGLGDTVLFRMRSADAPRFGQVDPVPLGPGDPTVRLVLDLVPARCDPHALAEDKVGTLIPVHVRATGLGPDASYDLPIDDRTRAELRGFWSTYCTG